MFRFEPTHEPDRVAVTFAVRADEFAGQTLAVVGDFNGWDPGAHPMQASEDGLWEVTVVLPAGGQFAFRYLAGDGSWLNDEDAPGLDNGMGGQNSGLDVPDAPPVPGRDEPSEPPETPVGPSAPQPSTPPQGEPAPLQDAAVS